MIREQASAVKGEFSSLYLRAFLTKTVCPTVILSDYFMTLNMLPEAGESVGFQTLLTGGQGDIRVKTDSTAEISLPANCLS